MKGLFLDSHHENHATALNSHPLGRLTWVNPTGDRLEECMASPQRVQTGEAYKFPVRLDRRLHFGILSGTC